MAQAKSGVLMVKSAAEIQSIVYDRQHASRAKTARAPSAAWAWVALLFTALVIYGSFLPFEPRAATWDQARRVVFDAPWLSLSEISRVDFIANGFLYAISAFIWCVALVDWRRPIGAIFWLSLILAGHWFIAVAVESAQLFFNRTVSRNDMVSEAVGSAIGVFAGLAFSNIVRSLPGKLASPVPSTLRLVAILTIIAYALNAMYPFDIALSLRELRTALSLDGKVRILGQMSSGRDLVMTGLKLVFGFAVGLLWFAAGNRSGRFRFGQLLTLLFFMFSILWGVQLLSLSESIVLFDPILVAIGCAMAFIFSLPLHDRLTQPAPAWLRPAIIIAMPIYFLSLLLLRGYKPQALPPSADVHAALERSSFLPFYFQYMMVSEEVAAASMVRVMAAFAPAGLALALWIYGRASRLRHISGIAFLVGALGAISVEILMLVLAAGRPDFTNGLFGGAGAAIAAAIAAWYVRCLQPQRQ
jgi:hypothetical protein